MATQGGGRDEPIGVPGVQGATIKAFFPPVTYNEAHHVGVTLAACPEVSQLAVADSSLPFRLLFACPRFPL